MIFEVFRSGTEPDRGGDFARLYSGLRSPEEVGA